MTGILIIEKTGTIKSLQLKNIIEEELYKKAGFKTSTHFKKHTTWKLKIDEKSYNIGVYGKTEGKANQENKYEFPPPIDQTLFFGNVVVVNKDENNQWSDLTVDEWETIYEYLYGGFEDLENDSEESEEEDIHPSQKTKSGYMKDGFIVEDSNDDFEDSSEYSESSDGKPPVHAKSSKKANSTATATTAAATHSKVNTKLPVAKQIQMIKEYVKTEIEPSPKSEDCTSELSEESYV